ncbi:MAG: hypothetical protein ACP5K5_01115 [Candidatus Micrarchaeia archaeon]
MAKRKAGKSSKAGKIDAIFIKLSSLVDLARQMMGPSSLKHLTAIKEGGAYRLVSAGERVSNMQIVYYATIEKIGKFFVYNVNAPEESIEMRDSIGSISDYNTLKAPVLELSENPFRVVKRPRFDIQVIEASDFESFVKSLISDSQYGGVSAKAYAFQYKGTRYIGSFELLRDTGKIFAYAKMKDSKVFNYLRYNYTNDKIEEANTVAEKAYTYVRVINLSEPFPFFTEKH